MLKVNRNQLSWAIVIVINIILIFSLSDSNAKETCYEELIKEQCKDYSLIIISLANIGIEHMSLYGYKRETTPNIDKWAQEAIIFENAFTHGSWTLPVATSLFTSLYPYTHRIVNRDIQNILDEGIKTLPEILKENGYKTAAFTGGLDYYEEFGHMRGFEKTGSNPNFTGFDVTLSQAEDWLSQNSDKKFFLFIHGYTAHSPFDPPEKFKGIFSNPEGKNITVDHKRSVRGFKNSETDTYEAYYAGGIARFRNPDFKGGKPVKFILTQDDIDYLRDLYDEEVLYVDSMIGNFLTSLDKKMLNKTIIVIFSEHGEMFAKHGRFGRAGTIRGTLYDDVIHIPLIIKFPEGPSKRINGLVQIIDIMPTIMDILDIPPLQKTQGRSLLSLINYDESVNDYVFAGLEFNIGRPFPQPFYPVQSINESIRDYKWKLIREVKFSNPNINAAGQIEEEALELYNLQQDPDELTNLADDYPDITKDLKEKLSQWAEWSRGFVPFHPSTQEIPKVLLEDARKHGYW